VQISEMAPCVSFRPHHACANFPLCQQDSRKRVGNRKKLCKTYCSTCSTRAMCAATGCDHPSVGVPSPLSDFCVEHALAHSLNAHPDAWPFCANSSTRGCRQFSVQLEGGLCFACASGHLPCCNAFHGCAKHVRDNTLGTGSCERRSGRKFVPCPFAQSLCSMCGLEKVDIGSGTCLRCAHGEIVCKACDLERVHTAGDHECRYCISGKVLCKTCRLERVVQGPKGC
jgi:hypothetical protein